MMLQREEKVWLVAFIIVVGFAFAVAYIYFQRAYLGAAFPKDTFLCMPTDAGNDFFHLFKTVRAGSPYAYKWSLYLPFTYIPIFLLTPFSESVAYGIFFALFFAGLVHLVFAQLVFLPLYQRCCATFVLSFLSYPVIFILDRGNFEVLVFLYLYAFLFYYQRDNLNLSVLFLACASSMKLYPLVFGVLFLTRKRWGYFILTGLVIAILTCGSAALYPDGIVGTFQHLSGKLALFKDVYVIGDGGLPYTASYFNVIKLFLGKYYAITDAQLNGFLPYYSIGALGIFGLCAAYVVFWERIFWKKVMILTCMMILLPQVTVDYKLIHLLFPLIFFITAQRETRLDFVYAVLFGLLLIPKAFYWISYKPTLQPIPVSNLLNPLLMTAVLLLIATEGLYLKRCEVVPSLLPQAAN